MRVLIYGAGVYGTITKKILSSQNVKVAYFIDRKFAGKIIEGVQVISPEGVEIYADDTIYIATKNYYSEVKKFLYSKGCKHVLDIRDILKSDISEVCLNDREKDIWRQRKAYEEVVLMDNKEGIKLIHVEAVVTERCSLKCKDCSSLMPYYEKAKNVNIDMLISWIENLLHAVTYIGELRILGGEPFLNPELDSLILQFAGHEKIGIITIYTNGTIVPNEKILRVIQENKVTIHISDYGIGEVNRNKLIDKCKAMQIKYSKRKYDEWYQFGNFEDNMLTEKALERMFKNCSSSFCLTILNGRLFRCPRTAHACALNFVDDIEESVDLSGDVVDKDKLENFLYKIKYLSTCRYCFGTSNEKKRVKAAIQVK